MILNKKLIIIILLSFLSACNMDDSLCYTENDYGNSGDYDTVIVGAGNSLCNYDKDKTANDLSQSSTVRECLNSKKILDLSGNIYYDRISETSKSTSCADLSTYIKENDFSDIVFYKEEQDLEKFNIINSIFSDCVDYCQEDCGKNNNSSSQMWTNANLKGNSYLGISLATNTVLNITAYGSIVLDSDNSTSIANFKKYGIEDINRSFYLKNGDLTTVNLQLNKNFITSQESGNSEETKKQNFKNRAYLSLKEYDSNLSYGDKYRMQDPNYEAIQCQYNENDKYFASCQFNYSGLIEDNSDFRSTVEKYYNDKYSSQQIRVFNKNDYYLYASDSFNKIEYDTRSSSILVNGKSISSEVDEEEDVGNYVKIQKDINGLEQVLNEFGGFDGYIWNDGKKEFKFTNKNPFKLAIKYLGENNLSKCEYSISFKDYNPSDKSGSKINNTYIAEYSGNKWHTIKNTIKSNNIISTGTEEVVFNRFATPNNNASEMLISISVESGGEECSKGIGLKVINLKDYYIYDTGFLMLSIPSINASNNNKIKYKLLNQDMITMSAGRNITAADKINEFFENNSDLKYEEMAISTVNDTNNFSTKISSLVDANKILYVRKGQILRFDYSNWMDIDDKDKITLKESDISGMNIKPYFGSGLNAFIIQNPLYICYGTAAEAISLENKCYNEGGTFESFTGSSGEVSECFIQVDECYLKGSNKGGIIEEFNSIDPSKNGTGGSCKKTLSAAETETLNDIEYTLQSFIAQIFLPVYNRGTIEYEVDGRKQAYTSSKDCYRDVIGSIFNQTSKCLTKLNTNNYKIYKGVVDDEENLESTRELVATVNSPINFLKNVKVTNKITNKEFLITDENGNLNNNFTIIKGCVKGATLLLNGSNFICDDTLKEEVFEALLDAINNAFYIKKTTLSYSYSNGENEVTDSSTTYTDHFYYYKDVCDGSKTTSGNCKVEGVSQCYNFSDYKGSIKNAINRIKANSSNSSSISETDISIYGFLNSLDLALGANKLSEFDGKKGGLIKNFTDSTETTSSDDTNNYYFLAYSDNVYVDSMSTFAFYLISSLTDSEIDFEQNFKNFIKKSGTFSGNIAIIKTESEHSYVNGDRLSVIIGKAKNNSGGNLYYYSKLNSGDIYYSNTEGGSAVDGKENDYFPIVVYDEETKNISKDSPYKFNSNGILVNSKDSTKGAYFEKLDVITIGDKYFGGIQEYISKEGTEKNLYFKVIDIDDKNENNSGSYTLTVNTYSASENKILAYFRDFFNKILSFIDGGYMKIEVNGDGYKVPCSEEINSKYCYIYNETNIMENGNNCVVSAVGNENCYSNCLKKDEKGEFCDYNYFYNGKGFIKNIFEMFVNDNLYQFVAKIALVLAITIYGFSYFFGLSNFTQGEIVTRIIRFCFIYFIISPSGWNFFNNFIIKFFKDGIDSLLFLVASAFDSNLMSDVNTAIITGDYSDKSALFSTTFSNFELIFSEQVFNKMIGLAFSGWFGFIYLYLVLSAIVNYITASLSAMVLYLSAQVYMSLVFCFFPLVVLFMFFERTKKTFDNWINLLIGFAGQQLFLVTTLSFFNLLVLTYIKSTFSYKVCLLPIFNLSIGGLPLALITFWKIPGTTFSDPIEKINEGMPSFYSIIGFYVISVLMTKFITGMVEVGKTIFGGIGIESGVAGSINQGISAVGNKGKEFMRNTGKEFGIGMAKRFLGGQAIDDYSKAQQQERTQRRQARANFFKGFKDEVDDKVKEYAKSDNFKKDLKDKLDNDPEYKRQKEISESKSTSLADKKEAQRKMKEIEKEKTKELMRNKRNETSGEIADKRFQKEYKGGIIDGSIMKDPNKRRETMEKMGLYDRNWNVKSDDTSASSSKKRKKNNDDDDDDDNIEVNV